LGDQIKEDEIGGHAARIEEIRNVYKILVGKPEGKDHAEDIGINVRIILEWI